MQEWIRSQSWNEEFWVVVLVVAVLIVSIVAGGFGTYMKR
jgi:hypothetical protein